MGRRKIEMYDYRNIILQLRKYISARSIARNLGISRNTVKDIKLLAANKNWLSVTTEPPTDEEIAVALQKHRAYTKKPSQIDQYSKQVRTWAEQGLTSTVIHRALRENYNFNAGYQVVQRHIKSLKITNDITIPLSFLPGEYVQVDFGKGPSFYDNKRKRKVHTWFFVMTLCWSRHQYSEIVERQDIETWLNCHKRAFNWFGGIPKNITIDNASCAIAKASYSEPEPTKSYLQFAEDYDFIINACPPYDPEKKGRVESGVKYVKNNFMPLRNFTSLEDANEQLKKWVLSVAGNRVHGTTKQQPLKVFTETEQILLNKLPKHDIPICVWAKAKIYRDCHIRYDKYKYSAPYKYVSREVWICRSESLIKIYLDHKHIATHPREPKNHDNISTHPEHLPPKAAAFLRHDAPWCIEKSKLIGKNCFAVISDILNAKHIDLLRSAQQLIYLKDKYGNKRLENACARAVQYGTLRYSVVKTILKNGTDVDIPSDIDNISSAPTDIYGQNSKFHREITIL